MAINLLHPERSVLLVVDIQEKFVPILFESKRLVARAKVMVEAAKLLGIPVIVSEQYPKGLGRTVPELRDALPAGAAVVEKTAFGCLGENGLRDMLHELGRSQVAVCGIEAHICVSQTVHQLLEQGLQAHLIEDAVSARSEENYRIGVRRMELAGAVPSSTEAALFEWMGHSKHPEFKAIQALIK